MYFDKKNRILEISFRNNTIERKKFNSIIWLDQISPRTIWKEWIKSFSSNNSKRKNIPFSEWKAKKFSENVINMFSIHLRKKWLICTRSLSLWPNRFNIFLPFSYVPRVQQEHFSAKTCVHTEKLIFIERATIKKWLQQSVNNNFLYAWLVFRMFFFRIHKEMA